MAEKVMPILTEATKSEPAYSDTALSEA